MAILDSPGLPLFDWEICQKVISAALKAALILDGLQATHSDLSCEACGRRGQKNTRPAIMVVGRMASAATRSILRRFSSERPQVPVLELNQCHPPPLCWMFLSRDYPKSDPHCICLVVSPHPLAGTFNYYKRSRLHLYCRKLLLCCILCPNKVSFQRVAVTSSSIQLSLFPVLV